jgi:hypothetical protein
VAYRSSTSNFLASGTPTTTVPAGVASGDVVIWWCTYDSSGVSTVAPTGFTILDTQSLTFDGDTLCVAYKMLTGADSGSYTGGTSNGNHDTCNAVAFSGRHASNVPVISTVNQADSSHATGFTASANGVTAVAGDDLLWLVHLDDNGNNTASITTPPSGFTARTNQMTNFTGSVSASEDNVSAGATGTLSGVIAISGGATAYEAWVVRIPAAPPANVAPIAPPHGLVVPVMRASIF